MINHVKNILINFVYISCLIYIKHESFISILIFNFWMIENLTTKNSRISSLGTKIT